MSKRKWSRKSTENIREALEVHDIHISANTIGEILKSMNYSLRSNRKTIAETYHKDRDYQFQVIDRQKKKFKRLREPIVSIDSKKKEKIGNFKNPGKIWRNGYDDVLSHDFPFMATGKATPFGIYDIGQNNGAISIGTSYDTPEFAVDTVESWLLSYGRLHYPHMKRLLILCDSGGSNGYRCRAWKYFLYHKICIPHGISLTVCHYPTGASKWNPIEHKLFSFISINWAGIPLRSLDIMRNCINGTKTKQGLTVDAIINTNLYEKGIKISKDEMDDIPITWGRELPQWNYTVSPKKR